MAAILLENCTIDMTGYDAPDPPKRIASDLCAVCKRPFAAGHVPPPGSFQACDACAALPELEPLPPGADWFMFDPKSEYRTATTLSLDGGFRDAIKIYKRRKDLTLLGIAGCGCAVTHSVKDAWQITDACKAHNRLWIVTVPRARTKDVQLAGPIDQVAFDVLVGVDYDQALTTYRRHQGSPRVDGTDYHAAMGLRSLAWCGCIVDRRVTGRRSDEHGMISETESWFPVRQCTSRDHHPLPTVRRL